MDDVTLVARGVSCSPLHSGAKGSQAQAQARAHQESKALTLSMCADSSTNTKTDRNAQKSPFMETDHLILGPIRGLKK